MKKEKETVKPEPKGSREDMFSNAKSLLLSSVGRLPTALVVILLISGAMAAVTGLVLHLNRPSDQVFEFMPLRLVPSQDALPIDPRKIQGNWIYQTTEYAMILTLIGDRFEWIVSFGDIKDVQYVARGNFRIVDDVMILGVRADLGFPRDPARPWMKYMPMSMKDLNTRFSFSGKKIIWDVPQSEQRRIIAQTSRIFDGHEDGHFEWTR